MRVGLLGGSFNPAHAGHRHVAELVRRRLQLDQVWLLVSPGNVLKPRAGMAPFAERLAGAAALADGRRIVASGIEAALGTRYSVDTLRLLRIRFPRVDFVWVMGADILEQLPRWRRWKQFVRLVPILVMPRPSYNLRALSGQAARRLRAARRPVTHGAPAGRRGAAGLGVSSSAATSCFGERNPRRPQRSRAIAKPPSSSGPRAPAPRASGPRKQAPRKVPRPLPAADKSPGSPRKKAVMAGPARPATPRRPAAPAPEARLDQLQQVIVASLDDDKAEDVVTLDLAGRAAFCDRMVVATGLADRQIAAMAEHLVEKLRGGRSETGAGGRRRRVGVGADRRRRHRRSSVQARGTGDVCARKDVERGPRRSGRRLTAGAVLGYQTSMSAAPAPPPSVSPSVSPPPGLPSPAGASPVMAQWFAMKAQQPDALLFLRMGDFYELFFTDAEAAASALDIALTARGEHAGAPIPMCGVPVHAAEAYLARLIRRGFRVAVAEQMEDPKTRTGKAPIRREVVRLVTPGTLTEDSLLEAARPNLLLALAAGRGDLGAAWLDISTGLFETAAQAATELPALLARLDPAEILAPAELALGEWDGRRGPETPCPPAGAARQRLAEAFAAASLDAFGSFTDAEAQAAATALDYVRASAAGALPHLSRPVPRGAEGVLAMDPATRASLELLRTRDGGTSHSLFAAVDRTVTAPGARLLGAWIAAPLTAPEAVAARQDVWSWMGANPDATTRLRAALRAAPDMARALGRLSMQRGGPRDLAALRAGLAAARVAAATLAPPLPPLLAAGAHRADGRPARWRRTLAAALTEPAPLRLDDGPAIRPGFDAELDAERGLRDDSRRVLAGMQRDYAQRFGVASLKIRHHAQLGYVIEVPAQAAERLRADPALTLRQSLANAARFATAELADLDRRIAEAAERALVRERAVLAHLVRAGAGTGRGR